MTSSLQIARGYPDYFGLVDQVTSMVTAVVPPSKTVLMVSKGDENLLTLGSRTGWHFPRQDDGRYAGYYPTDSADAIAQLEDQRRRGAGYVVFPATSLWWLDHYPEFSRHLQDRYTCVVRDDDVCAIYALTEQPAEPVARANGETPRAHAATRDVPVDPAHRLPVDVAQLVSFIDAILPPLMGVAVISSGDERVAELTGRETWHFPRDRSAGSADTGPQRPDESLRQLEDLRRRGIGFLVVPRGTPWLADHPEFLEQMERVYRCVARRRYLCTVYDLNRPSHAQREATPGREPSHRRRWFRAGSHASEHEQG